MLEVESHGRHRYYRIASAAVVSAIEALAQIAPAFEVRSLRQHTRAHALREGRLCYDHLAGRLGVALMRALIDDGALQGGDGTHTEQCHHLAGALGAAIAQRLIEQDWVRPRPQPRAVELTDSGHRKLQRTLGLRFEPS